MDFPASSRRKLLQHILFVVIMVCSLILSPNLLGLVVIVASVALYLLQEHNSK